MSEKNSPSNEAYPLAADRGKTSSSVVLSAEQRAAKRQYFVCWEACRQAGQSIEEFAVELARLHDDGHLPHLTWPNGDPVTTDPRQYLADRFGVTEKRIDQLIRFGHKVPMYHDAGWRGLHERNARLLGNVKNPKTLAAVCKSANEIAKTDEHHGTDEEGNTLPPKQRHIQQALEQHAKKAKATKPKRNHGSTASEPVEAAPVHDTTGLRPTDDEIQEPSEAVPAAEKPPLWHLWQAIAAAVQLADGIAEVPPDIRTRLHRLNGEVWQAWKNTKDDARSVWAKESSNALQDS